MPERCTASSSIFITILSVGISGSCISFPVFLKLDSKIDSEKMYGNLMKKFKFGGIDQPGIYIDENVMRMCYTHRRIFTQLVGQLIKEGKKDKALASISSIISSFL